MDKSHKLLLFEKSLEVDHYMHKHPVYLECASLSSVEIPPVYLCSLTETLHACLFPLKKTPAFGHLLHN